MSEVQFKHTFFTNDANANEILSFIESYQVNDQWWCRDETDCLPWSEEKNPPVDRLYESQNLCRLMCGKHGGLWPRPSGVCYLKKSTINVNTNLIR